ncbi:MAG: putative peptide transporter permease protein [Mycobacterium sp.]|jgi:peptide/nickel transport system permease protein|nr:putative peptide transporter permease protein [Mycobacterium sp.]
MLAVALFAVVLAMALLPGNGVRALLGRDASQAEIDSYIRELGLDRPVLERFSDWFAGLVRGDFGETLRGESVNALLASRLPNTLALALPALALTLVLSTIIAVWWTGGDRPVFGRLASVGTTVVIALPEFVVATVLVLVLGLTLDVLPAVTMQNADGRPASLSMYVLPIVALSIPQIGWNSRVFAAAIREARTLPYVRAAEIDGVAETTLFLRYILRPALPTMIASLATTVGMIVGGSVVVESLFNFPGVGALVAASVATRDVNIVAAVVASTGIVIVVMLLSADAVHAWTRGHTV